MKRRYKILLLLAALLAGIVGCLIILVGPWPTYKSGFEDKSYYMKALAEIEKHRENSSVSSNIGQFEAGIYLLKKQLINQLTIPMAK